MTCPFHPLANVFPLIEGAEFDRLVADIAANGLLNPIVILDDMILDGRNRERACRAAGVELACVPFTGKDPVAFVVSQNLARRHLNESQRAVVAAKLATFEHGGDRSKASIDALSQAAAGKLLNVSKPSVERAKKVQREGAP